MAKTGRNAWKRRGKESEGAGVETSLEGSAEKESGVGASKIEDEEEQIGSQQIMGARKKKKKKSTGLTSSSCASSPSSSLSSATWDYCLAVIKLSRPKFLFYSAFLHMSGALLALLQKVNRCDVTVADRSLGSAVYSVDWSVALFLQITISVMHLATHFLNEYADYEVDRLNTNAGAWTGGSKVLQTGLVSRTTSLILGVVLSIVSILYGAATVERYWYREHGITLIMALRNPYLIWLHLPTDFVLIGVSVVAVAFAYSVEPLRLSAQGLGEPCVSYVLTFAAPGVGYVLQGGVLDRTFLEHILPLFVINIARMIVMNIPDREGDLKGGKHTSVVMIGEQSAVYLNSLLYVLVFLYIVPSLPTLSLPVRVCYLALLPLRWFISLRLHQPEWWTDIYWRDVLPFYESLFVLASVLALNVSLLYDLFM